MRDHPLVLMEGVDSLSRTEVGLPKVEERLYVERQQYFVYELEGEAIEGAESSVGSPREGGCYRLTNADMFASWEPFHGALEISAVVGSDSNNGVSLVLAEAVFGGGGISIGLTGVHCQRQLVLLVGRGTKLDRCRWWVTMRTDGAVGSRFRRTREPRGAYRNAG